MKGSVILLAVILQTLGTSAWSEGSLEIGVAVPPLTLITATGNSFHLAAAARGQWTVLAYLRGSWCPYANRQLKEFRRLEEPLMQRGGTIIAIAPESPRQLLTKVVELELGLVLLSDDVFDAARSFGILERLPPGEAAPFLKARAAMIPLGRDEGYLVPQAAVWLIDPDGKVAAAWKRERGAGFIEADALMREWERLRVLRPSP